MKKFPALAVIVILCLVNSLCANAQDIDPNMGIIPAPVSVKKAEGNFTLDFQTSIKADSMNNKAVAFFINYTHRHLLINNPFKRFSNKATTKSIIEFTSKGTENLPAQGYRITITPKQITVAGKGAGLFYGVQTLIQLVPDGHTGAVKIPCVTIEDYPRFAYRGLMLDVSRHFFTVDFIKQYIDLMVTYKLNNFHWHLTDDQGWRIEIKKYPKLTEVGSQRAQTLIGEDNDRNPQQFDNTPYGGYYTQDQIRDVVKYAADRYINIVPEIEMPGHSSAAVTAYPELSCEPDGPHKVVENWGVFTDIYCPTDKTFSFLEDVLTEVMALFPSKYIHIGGDEVPKDAWKKSAFCQELMKKLNLKNEEELQSYFVQRIEKFVNSKGRSTIGWDEILEGGLSPHATVMSWRGEEGGIAASQQKHDVVMTPINEGMYISSPEEKSNDRKGQYVTLYKTYRYNPTPAALTDEQKKYVIGVQACMWAEHLNSPFKAEHSLLPRLLAMSEVGWTSLANKNFTDFVDVRLPGHLARFDKQGLDYYVPEAIGTKDTIMFGDKLLVDLKPSVAGAKIYYTIDGLEPTETAIQYTTPITYNIPAENYRELKTIVMTPSGKRSQVSDAIMYNTTPLKATGEHGKKSGLKYKLMKGKFNSTDQLKYAAVTDSGTVKDFDLADFKKNNPSFGLEYTGYINAEADGNYQFSIQSANGSALLIDGQLVIDNDGRHRLYEQGGAVPLQKGYHQITIKYFNTGNRGALKLFMTAPGKAKTEVTTEMLTN